MYWTLYVIFGLMFLSGVVAYWVVSRAFIGMNELPGTAKESESKK